MFKSLPVITLAAAAGWLLLADMARAIPVAAAILLISVARVFGGPGWKPGEMGAPLVTGSTGRAERSSPVRFVRVLAYHHVIVDRLVSLAPRSAREPPRKIRV